MIVLLFGVLWGVIYFKLIKKRYPLGLHFDLIVPCILIGQILGRWGNFFNQEAYGQIIKLSTLEKLHLPQFIIDGMYINGFYRQPTFLYESVMSIIGFIILMIIRRNSKIKTGQITSIYLIWYGIVRLVIESMRSDSLMLGPLKIAQVVSIIFIAIGMIIIIKSLKNEKYINDNVNINTRRKLCTKK